MQHSLPIINLIAYLLLVIINYMAAKIPFFGRSPGDVSDLFPNLLTPPDFTFRIWAVVYILLGGFAFFQSRILLNKQKTIPTEISAIGFLFLVSCIFNLSWLMAWQTLHIGLAFSLIFILWILLIWIYTNLVQLEKVDWRYMLPFSVYLAWVCVAALANLNVLLIQAGFEFWGLTEQVWTAGLLGIGICGTLLIVYLTKDIWFTLVLLWTFYGIYIKNKQLDNDQNEVVLMTILAMIILTLAIIWMLFKKWHRSKKDKIAF